MNVYNIGDYCYYKEPIGHGSFSIIYKGYCYSTKQTVAIKKIIKLVDTKYFDREVSLMRKLDHPNILKLYDVVRKKDGVYLVLEFCNGGDLAKYIHKKNYKWDMQYFNEISDGLKYLHKNNILHRDIKPQNILIHNNHIKISDFGFAKSFESHELITTFCGSPLYMAPEIIKDREYDSKSDIWSLGVIFYELLTKRHPYYIKTRKQLYSLIANGHNINFDIIKNSRCRRLIQNMLEPDPNKRYEWSALFEEADSIVETIHELSIKAKNGVCISDILKELHSEQESNKLPNNAGINCLNNDTDTISTQYIATEPITNSSYEDTINDTICKSKKLCAEDDVKRDTNIDEMDEINLNDSHLDLYDFTSITSYNSEISISENDDEIRSPSKPIMIPNQKNVGKQAIIYDSISPPLLYQDNSRFSNPEKIDRGNSSLNDGVSVIEHDDYRIVSRSAPTINLMDSMVCDYMKSKINESVNMSENFHIIGTSPVLQPMGFTNYLDKSVKTISGLLNFKL
jgi:serine/threonine-protein kinase ULK/ATG1